MENQCGWSCADDCAILIAAMLGFPVDMLVDGDRVHQWLVRIRMLYASNTPTRNLLKELRMIQSELLNILRFRVYLNKDFISMEQAFRSMCKLGTIAMYDIIAQLSVPEADFKSPVAVSRCLQDWTTTSDGKVFANVVKTHGDRWGGWESEGLHTFNV